MLRLKKLSPVPKFCKFSMIQSYLSAQMKFWMKKSMLFSALCIAMAGMAVMMHSCAKKDSVVRLSYAIDTINQNVYVGDTGYTHWPLKVSFLNGNPQESLTLTVNGLPARLTVSPDSLTAVPTFIEDFVFHTNYAIHGSYPANITAYSLTTGYKVFHFNIVVVTANCAMAMAGSYSGSSACIYATSPYTAVATAAGGDTLNIMNLGGLGTSSNTKVILNCGTDSLTIPSQADGNGDTLRGNGVFTANQMIINYSKKTITGGYDSCSATLNRQ